ncbi:MAG: transcriptional repressor, partial [Clostridium sp.]|nr:transcriptional repressor [Clostridium sp.]
MENITSIFREKKLKLTPQRLAVYKYLMSTNEHPSAEIIYKA